MEKENKRGELTSQQIVTIVILIVSFVIILAFIVSLNLKAEVNKESCRNSVILRGSALGKSTSLQCKTQEVCISGGEECNNLGKDAVTIKAETKEELFNELSDLLYDCWYQMGEGKIDYAPTGFGFEENYCAICNTIKFDEKIKGNEELRTIKAEEFYRYLQAKKIPNEDKSYLNYLYGVNSLDAVRESILQKTTEAGTPLDIYNENIDFGYDKGYAIITGIIKQGRGITLISTGVGIAAGITIAVMATPAAGIASAKLVQSGFVLLGTSASAKTGGILGGLIGLVLSSGDEGFTPPNIYPFDGETVEKLDCKQFTSLA